MLYGSTFTDVSVEHIDSILKAKIKVALSTESRLH